MADIARLSTLIRQLQELLQGERRVRGTVSAAGAVVVGSGFTVVRNGAGDYTVTFTTAFAAVPTVVVGTGATGATLTSKLKNGVSPTTTAFSVYTFVTTTGTLTDGEFHFNAIGP